MKRYRKKPDTVAKIQQEIIEHKHSLVWTVNSFRDGVQLIDPYEKQFPILYINKGFTEMTGYKNEEAVGRAQCFTEGLHTNEEASKKIIHAIEYEQNHTIEILNYHKNGTTFWNKVHINPLYSPEGELFACMIIQKDISHMIANILQDTSLTHDSPYKPHTNFITFVNKNGYIEKTNDELSGLVKKEDEHLLGNHITYAVVEEDIDKIMRSFESAIQGSIENLTLKVLGENKNVIQLDLLYIPSYKNNEINGVYCVYKNITGNSNTTKLVNVAEKYESVKNIAYNIAGDMHYPLVLLKGFTELLEANSESNHAYINLIQSEIKRLEQIKTNIYLFSRPHVIIYKRLNMQYLLEQAGTSLNALFISRFIELKLTYRARSKHIYGDKDKLTQVFLLLLKNAIDASTENNNGFIHIDVHDNGDTHICIKVMDKGQGIAAENIEKVTEPFYTTKKYGVGIGLTICKQFVQEHHGTLSIYSELDKGTTVEVILPLKEPNIKK